MRHHFDMNGRPTRRRFLMAMLSGIATAATGGCGGSSEPGQALVPPTASPMLPTVVPPVATTAPAVTVAASTTIMLPTEVEEAPTATPERVTATETPAAAPAATVAATLSGVLQARPAATASAAVASPGVQPLGLAAERDTLLYVPAGYTPEKPARLVVLLHGAGGIAEHGLSLLQGLADQSNLLLLAPASRRQTWDVIADQYGPDVALIDQALLHVFTHYATDPTRLAIGGFSDGASYALSLGIINGDLFTHIMAFSPGFMAPTRHVGKPQIFISHGTRDEVLPIDRCSRRIVPRLEREGYTVDYREFEGPHTVPPEMTQAALTRFIV